MEAVESDTYQGARPAGKFPAWRMHSKIAERHEMSVTFIFGIKTVDSG